MHHYSFFVQIYMREAKLANEVRNCIERVCSKSPSSSTAMIHCCTGESRYFLSGYEYQYYNKISQYCDIVILHE